MIPVKITCGCGQKYAFDVEPTDTGIGCPVECPACGADGSVAANQVIARHLQGGSPALLRIAAPKFAPAITARPPLFPQPVPPTARKSFRTRKWLIPALVFMSVLVITLTVVALSRDKSARPPASGRSLIANDGYPHSPGELNSWYVQPPAGQNAATFNSEAFAALHLDGISNLPLLGKAKLPPVGTPLPASMKSALVALIDSNGEVLRLLEEGAKHDQSRYAVDLSRGFESLMPHLGHFREAALLLELAAILHTEEHNQKQAVDDLHIAFALTRSLEAEPFLISQFVRSATVSIVVAALERTLNRTTLSPEALTELLGVLQQMENRDASGQSFDRALIGERANALAILEAPEKLLQKLTGPDSATIMRPKEREQWIAALKACGNAKQDLDYFEATFQQLMLGRKNTFPERLTTDDLIHKRVSEAEIKKLPIIGLLMPSFGSAAAKEAGCVAQLRLAQTALGLEQFRSAHTQYPAALSELPSSGGLIDPFDGQPLRYRKQGAGYLLYSIGPDRKDDSGRRENGKQSDLVFAIVRGP